MSPIVVRHKQKPCDGPAQVGLWIAKYHLVRSKQSSPPGMSRYRASFRQSNQKKQHTDCEARNPKPVPDGLPSHAAFEHRSHYKLTGRPAQHPDTSGNACGSGEPASRKAVHCEIDCAGESKRRTRALKGPGPAARRLLFASIVYLPVWFVLNAAVCNSVRGQRNVEGRIFDSLNLMMHAQTSPLSSSRPRTIAVARFAWITLCCNVAVVLWGAYVRATGSGAGCGNKWPLCDGNVLSTSARAQTIIEFTHRMTSGIALLMVAALVIWCWRATSRGDWARYSAILAAIFLANEALLGAALVLLDHVAQDKSAGRVLFLCLHFGNTLLLLATLSLTAGWLSNGNGRFTLIRKPGEVVAISVGLLATMLIGITGAVAALADTLFPATSLRLSVMQDFSPGVPALLHFRPVHPVVAVIAGAYILWVIVRSSQRRGRLSKLAISLVVLLSAQLSLGVLNVLLLTPVWLQILHLFVGDVFWIALVLASAKLLLVNASPHQTKATVVSPFKPYANAVEDPNR
jgi:heme a synthase